MDDQELVKKFLAVLIFLSRGTDISYKWAGEDAALQIQIYQNLFLALKSTMVMMVSQWLRLSLTRASLHACMPDMELGHIL